MDAPLTLTTRLNPMELDKEALHVDAGWSYSTQFYESTKNQPHPKDVLDRVDLVVSRIGTIGAVRGYGYTHEASSLDDGPKNSAYKTLGSMADKMSAQLLRAATSRCRCSGRCLHSYRFSPTTRRKR